jgi:hypothetical protein
MAVRRPCEKGLVNMPVITNLRRRFTVALVSAGLVVSGATAASAQADSGADLTVGLGAFGIPLLVGASYNVSVTNNGPEPLTSATVVVRIDPRVWTAGGTPPCPLDVAAATLTCTFGALSVGASTSLRSSVYFRVSDDRATLLATATRTASDPGDPNAGNDTASATCQYRRPPEGSNWPPPTWCAPPS